MNVSKPTIEALYAIITECFKLNRWCDRFVSVLGVKFAMNNTARLCHKIGFAHFYPTFSDEIGDRCLERYNISVEYGATPEGKEDYSNPRDMIVMLRDKTIDFQNMYIGLMKIAFENNDLHIYSTLTDLSEQLSLRTEQAILLVDKLALYDTLGSYDAHIEEHFWVLGGETDDN